MARGGRRLGEVGGRGMRVEQGDRGSGDLGALELFDSSFETCNVFAHNLSPRLPLPIVVLARISLLGSDTLQTGWLPAVAPLP